MKFTVNSTLLLENLKKIVNVIPSNYIHEYTSYFKNVSLVWDNCGCEQPCLCSGERWVIEINIKTGDGIHLVEYEDGDHLYFQWNDKQVKIPESGATVYDFIRACELCNIDIELSDYAVYLFDAEVLK